MTSLKSAKTLITTLVLALLVSAGVAAADSSSAHAFSLLPAPSKKFCALKYPSSCSRCKTITATRCQPVPQIYCSANNVTGKPVCRVFYLSSSKKTLRSSHAPQASAAGLWSWVQDKFHQAVRITKQGYNWVVKIIGSAHGPIGLDKHGCKTTSQKYTWICPHKPRP